MSAAKFLSLIKKCLSHDRQMDECGGETGSCQACRAPVSRQIHAGHHDHWPCWRSLGGREYHHVKHDQYVAPTCGVTSERTARDITTQNLPPSISISEDGEEGYGNSQRMLRKQQQVYESYAKVACVQPPPNRTVFQGESPPPYRSRSVGALSQSASIARKTSLIKAKDMTMTSPTAMASASPAAQLSNNNNHVISSNFNLLDGPPVIHGSGEHTLCNCPRRLTAGERQHTVIRGGATTAAATSALTSTSMTTASSCLAGDATRRRGSCQGDILHNCAIDSGCEHYGVTCGLGPPPPYTDTQCVSSNARRGGGGIQYNSSI